MDDCELSDIMGIELRCSESVLHALTSELLLQTQILAFLTETYHRNNIHMDLSNLISKVMYDLCKFSYQYI